MRDYDCVELLQWALPKMRMRWAGFRRVRGQVCKRISRRMAELGHADLGSYRALVEADGAEWARLETFCRITISRFYRREGERWRIDPAYRESIAFVRQDVREELPDGAFHLVFCRNLVFTYYDDALQRSLLARLAQRLVPGGVLVCGIHESPPRLDEIRVRDPRLGIHVREP